MNRIEVFDHHTVYDNPIPTLRSRHAFFPGLARLANGELIAMFPIGEAFESADQMIHVSRSSDDGRTWSKPTPLHPKARRALCSMKPTLLDDGTLLGVGYSIFHKSPEMLVNPETGGLPPGKNLVAFSTDNGHTWTLPQSMGLRARPEVLETSGPAIQIKGGDVLAIATPMPMWDGTKPSGSVGFLLRSKNRGRTWNNKTIYFDHPPISPFEARLCQMADGRIVAIVWALDEKSGKCHNNQVVVSRDDGKTWSGPIDTGIYAQASNLIALDGNRLLTIHAHRQSEPVGVFVRLVELGDDDRWNVLAEASAWDRAAAAQVTGFADMGANLKFGQPSLLSLNNGEFLAYHWAIENGQGKILSHRLRLTR